MPSRKDLPFLITLLEDDSWVVRNQVVEELKRFGPKLEKEVGPYRYALDAESWLVLEEILEDIRDEEFATGWLNWLDLGNSKAGLERALINLSFLEFGSEAYGIEKELDVLAEDFLNYANEMNVEKLMEFMFLNKKFRAPKEHEETYLHDSLLFSLRQRVGSHLTLTSIAILVAWRAGLDVHGVVIQGNFLPMSFEDGKMKLYNTYNEGKHLPRSSAMYIEEAFRRDCLLPSEMKAQVHEVVNLILKNAIAHFDKKGRKTDVEVYEERLEDLQDTLKTRGMV